ncbi:hypothetical protein IVB55_05690 [Bradyrhizobium sp. CW4]|uniref:hypothetical protein n=1 Tax=Bradyrhizobium sp. CW4 TaxID=2782687 RepID=UPI001FFA23E8|nr:hypothetical protein [Bradyrhizobium sp. CW4]MCK1412521.1 hypothetical protein [Bradyrhizobium sp. CW4]
MKKSRKKVTNKPARGRVTKKRTATTKRKTVARKTPPRKRSGLTQRSTSLVFAAATTLDRKTCAGHVFGETSVLSSNAAKLADARRFIAGVAYKRNGTGIAPPKIPTEDELTNPNTAAIWNRCLKAADDAAGDDVDTCKHFVVWFSDDDGKTPSKQPSRIPDEWPYDQTDKIKGNWGPFVSPVPPKGNNIFVIKYCGVP